MEVIRGKTAMLFEASTHSAAALCGATAEQAEALRTLVITWAWRSNW